MQQDDAPRLLLEASTGAPDRVQSKDGLELRTMAGSCLGGWSWHSSRCCPAAAAAAATCVAVVCVHLDPDRDAHPALALSGLEKRKKA